MQRSAIWCCVRKESNKLHDHLFCVPEESTSGTFAVAKHSKMSQHQHIQTTLIVVAHLSHYALPPKGVLEAEPDHEGYYLVAHSEQLQ